MFNFEERSGTIIAGAGLWRKIHARYGQKDPRKPSAGSGGEHGVF